MAQIYVKVLSEDHWFGAWAPIQAIPSNVAADVFILADNNLSEDDEYEFFIPGAWVRVQQFQDHAGEAFLGAIEEVTAGRLAEGVTAANPLGG